MSLIKLIYLTLFGSESEHLDGSTLFAGEYVCQWQFDNIKKLFGDNAIVRVPFTDMEQKNLVFNTVSALSRSGVSAMILLDRYGSHQSMLDRLDYTNWKMPQVKTFQLFNELPHMRYEGDPILTIQSLLDKTNRYTALIKTTIPDSTVVGMAPYNCMDETDEVWGMTNIEILKNIILYTDVDVAAVHFYGDSFGKKMDLMRLAGKLQDWLDEAPIKKKVWVTECGVDGWVDHIAYYRKMVRLFCNAIEPEKVMWYRQAVKNCETADNQFALEFVEDGNQSPLWEELCGKT
jgi:hypothetical protein